MTYDLKPYPAMKHSGVPWLGEVPQHWEVRRLKQICHLAYGDALATEVREHGTVPVYGSNGRVGLHSSANTKAPCIVIGRKGSFGKVNFSTEPVFAIDTTFFVDHRFSVADLRWLFFLLAWLQLDKVSKDSAVPGLDREDAYQRVVVLPPPPEQSAIVRFLDHAEGQIGRYIRSKQKLIKLLEEQKQAIIHRAVTRGLDPNVRLKPSGVEWLGDMPEHWRVSRIKSLAQTGTKTFTDGDWIELPYITDHGVRLIQTGNVGRGEYREKGFRFVSENTFRELKCTEVSPGDILICRLDGPVGRACLAPDLRGKAITSVDNTILKVRSDIDPRYVVSVLSSLAWLDWIQSICRAGGGFRYRVSRSMLGDARLPRPPYIEQLAIADHLHKCLLAVRRIADGENAAIARLREYRARLVADVVTGKLDVREAAARLPVEAEEPEPITEVETAAEESEHGEGVDVDAVPEEAEA